MTIKKQGTVVTTGGIIYTPPQGTFANINNIRITNSAATNFNLELYRYTTTSGMKTLLYSFTLGSGDTLNDDTEYKLEAPDYLWLKPSVVTVQYTIQGIEIPLA